MILDADREPQVLEVNTIPGMTETSLLPEAAAAASIERLRSFVRDTQTARASFIQTVTDRQGRMVQRATGELGSRWPVAGVLLSLRRKGGGSTSETSR